LREKLPYFAAVLVLGLVVALAWANRQDLRPVEVGGPAPEINARDLEGNPVSIVDYRGRVVLLNIWATWCTPCKEEMPSMQALYERLQGEDFEILAVSIDRAPADYDPSNPLGGKLRSFADSLGLTFTILHDPQGEITTAYQTTGVPESFILDREGVIAQRITGPRPWDSPRSKELVRSVLTPDVGSGQ
jgi:peroxiredoxin